MIPPGMPDFYTQKRFVEAGHIRLAGRAWSGIGPVERVQVGIDGTWSDAVLDAPLGPFAWQAWSFEWNATVGEHELTCRARDAAGNVQPLDPPWNYQGMGNNVVQRITVTVR
jgi:sulfane dehydrogenase subunit SoxC